VIEVRLGQELHQAAENMYLSLDLPRVVADLILSLDPSLHRRLLSNIVLTGGNSRLNGLSMRLVRDLEAVLPASLASCVHVVDPRLMTGRSDAVIGAAYVRKWCHAKWTTRCDYILDGLGEQTSNITHAETDISQSSCDDGVSSISSSAWVTPDDVVQEDAESYFGKLNELSLLPQFRDAEKSSLDKPNPNPLPYCHYPSSPDSESLDISVCDEVISSAL